eukprot:6329528-Karenia_brevis.AAC.1
MITEILKTLPSEWPKVQYLSVKSGLPEFSGTLRQIKRIGPDEADQADQVSFVRFGTSPTRAG